MSTYQWINHLKSPHFATVIKLYPPEEQDLPVYIVDVSLDDDEVAGNHNYQDVSRVPAEKDTQYQKKCIITFIGTTGLFMFKIT